MKRTNRINQLFETGKTSLLSVFYTAGYPHLTDTVGIGQLLESAGADIIEIGIPFSDPIADGPVIQESNNVALANGMTVQVLLDQVAELRRTVKLPVILMGYLNPVMQYGVEKFCRDAAAAGVDGLILPDMLLEVFEREYRSAVDSCGLSNTFLISPTTSEERIRQIDSLTDGFIYAVSSSSTTGGQGSFSEEQVDYFRRLHDMKLKNPFLIGFGISNAETFKKACSFGRGAIVGSAFISMLKASGNFEKDIAVFIQGLRDSN